MNWYNKLTAQKKKRLLEKRRIFYLNRTEKQKERTREIWKKRDLKVKEERKKKQSLNHRHHRRWRNTAGGKSKVSLAIKRYRERLSEFLLSYKEKRGCARCPEKYPWALDFHHLDPNEKEINIGASKASKGWRTLKKEIKKCIILCRNCHAKEHWGPFAKTARKKV